MGCRDRDWVLRIGVSKKRGRELEREREEWRPRGSHVPSDRLYVFLFQHLTLHSCLLCEPTSLSAEVSWKKYTWIPHVEGVAVLIRNFVRIVEFAKGADDFISTHEATAYRFNARVIWRVVLLSIVARPGWLPKAVLWADKIASPARETVRRDSRDDFAHPSARIPPNMFHRPL